MPIKIFIDTEFTDFADMHLISLGMVTEAGVEEYVELPFPRKSCSEFVQQTVIPLLGHIEGAYCELTEVYERISKWLNQVRPTFEDVEICFDYQADWELFTAAMNFCPPLWCKPRLISRNINELLRYKYHKDNDLPEHHALYDARANRYAFRERPSIAK